jgi:hypothetical protein
MANDIEIRIVVKDNGASKKLVEIGKAMDDLDKKRYAAQAARAAESKGQFDALYAGFAAQGKAAQDAERAQHGMQRGITAIASSVNVLQTALGDNLPPAAKKAFDGLSTIAGAAMTGASVAGPYGAAIGAAASAIVVLGAAAMQSSPQVQAFNDELAKASAPDQAAQGLAQLAGVTEKEARAALTAAASNKEFATTLAQLSKDAQTAGGISALEKSVDAIGKKMGEATTSAKQLFVIYQYGAAYASRLASSLGDHTKAQEYANTVAKQAMDITFGNAEEKERLNRLTKDGAAAVAEENRIVGLYKQNIGQAAREQTEFNNRIREMVDAHKKAQKDFGADIVKAEKDLNEQRVKLSKSANDDIARANRDLAKERVKIDADLLEKLGDMEQDRGNKNSEAYYQYAKDVREFERDITQAVEEHAQERLRIERDARQAMADFDADLGLKLNDAQTENAAARIRYEADLERARMRRETGDQLDALAKKKKASDDEFAHKRQLRDEDYAHAQMLDDRDYGITIGRMQREAAQARDAATQRTNDEIAQIEARKSAQERAAEEQTRKQIDGIRERAAEETLTFNANVAREKARHTERVTEITDLRTESQKLSADMAALANPAWQPWLTQADAYRDKILGMPTLPAFSTSSQDVGGGGGSSGFGGGFAAGGSFIVPSGFPNDSFPMRVQSGERVTVTPANQVGAGARGGVTITGGIVIHVNGAKSPRATAEEIRSALNDLVMQ